MQIARSRIAKELAEIERTSASDGYRVEVVNDDLTEMRGFFRGPDDTPFSGGSFRVSIQVPQRYPFVPPKVKFETKIWHPNVSSVTGTICLDILKNEWAAAMSIRTVLISLQALLCRPEPSDPQDAVVADQLLNCPHIYKLIARQWTRKYAEGPSYGEEDKEFEKKIEELLDAGVSENDVVSVLSNSRLDVAKALEIYFK